MGIDSRVEIDCPVLERDRSRKIHLAQRMRLVFRLEAIGRASVVVKNVNFEAANQF